MNVKLLAIAPAVVLTLATLMASRTEVGATNCPSPAPTCSSAGSLTDLSGTYGCTEVSTDSTGTVSVQLLKLDADGAGNITGKSASNSNAAGNTFSDFSALAAGATYCLNSDDTGYIFPTGDCPLALVIDDFLGEVRLIKTAENFAGAMTCRAQ